jgi:hypothetical protein
MSQEKSDRFLAAFARIEKRLRELTKGSKEDTFRSLLSRALSEPIFRRFAEDLREFADLRGRKGDRLLHRRA